MLGLSTDEIFQRAKRAEQAARRRSRVIRSVIGGLALLLVSVCLGWWNQAWIKDQYSWYTVMRPSLLTSSQEQALKHLDKFQECAKGCPKMVAVVQPPDITLGPSRAA